MKRCDCEAGFCVGHRAGGCEGVRVVEVEAHGLRARLCRECWAVWADKAGGSFVVVERWDAPEVTPTAKGLALVKEYDRTLCVVFERGLLRTLAVEHPDEVLMRSAGGRDLLGQAVVDYLDSFPPERVWFGCYAPRADGSCPGHAKELASVAGEMVTQGEGCPRCGRLRCICGV